jgi:hypothetical protein
MLGNGGNDVSSIREGSLLLNAGVCARSFVRGADSSRGSDSVQDRMGMQLVKDWNRLTGGKSSGEQNALVQAVHLHVDRQFTSSDFPNVKQKLIQRRVECLLVER